MLKAKEPSGIREWISFVILMACGLLGRLYLHTKISWMVDSDQAAELMLAFKLNEEKSIISKNWFYSTELRVFETQWFYRIGAWLFPEDWSRARIVSVLLIMIVTTAAAYWFAQKAGFGKCAKLFAFLLMMPFGKEYFLYTIQTPYYQPYYFFIYVTLGLVLDELLQRRGTKGRTLFRWVVGAAVAIMSGCNGYRQMLILYLPFFLAAFLILTAEVRKNCTTLPEIPEKCGRQWTLFLFSLWLAFCNFIGIVINYFLAKVYHFSTFGELAFSAGHNYTFAYLLWDFLHLFGYREGVRFFSIEGIGSLVGLALAFAVVFSAVRICWKFKTRSVVSRFLLIFFGCDLAVNLTVFRFLNYYHEYHLLPVVPLGIALVVLELKEEATALQITRPLPPRRSPPVWSSPPLLPA